MVGFPTNHGFSYLKWSFLGCEMGGNPPFNETATYILLYYSPNAIVTWNVYKKCVCPILLGESLRSCLFTVEKNAVQVFCALLKEARNDPFLGWITQSKTEMLHLLGDFIPTCSQGHEYVFISHTQWFNILKYNMWVYLHLDLHRHVYIYIYLQIYVLYTCIIPHVVSQDWSTRNSICGVVLVVELYNVFQPPRFPARKIPTKTLTLQWYRISTCPGPVLWFASRKLTNDNEN